MKNTNMPVIMTHMVSAMTLSSALVGGGAGAGAGGVSAVNTADAIAGAVIGLESSGAVSALTAADAAGFDSVGSSARKLVANSEQTSTGKNNQPQNLLRHRISNTAFQEKVSAHPWREITKPTSSVAA